MLVAGEALVMGTLKPGRCQLEQIRVVSAEATQVLARTGFVWQGPWYKIVRVLSDPGFALFIVDCRKDKLRPLLMCSHRQLRLANLWPIRQIIDRFHLGVFIVKSPQVARKVDLNMWADMWAVAPWPAPSAGIAKLAATWTARG